MTIVTSPCGKLVKLTAIPYTNEQAAARAYCEGQHAYMLGISEQDCIYITDLLKEWTRGYRSARMQDVIISKR